MFTSNYFGYKAIEIFVVCRLKEDFHGEHGYQKIAWTYWFKKVLYYQVALVYVFTRLITNVSQVRYH